MSGYPPGVTGREDYFWPEDDPECDCGHPQSDHGDTGLDDCRAHDEGFPDDPDAICPCSAFEPPGG